MGPRLSYVSQYWVLKSILVIKDFRSCNALFRYYGKCQTVQTSGYFVVFNVKQIGFYTWLLHSKQDSFGELPVIGLKKS